MPTSKDAQDGKACEKSKKGEIVDRGLRKEEGWT